jgi:hypothetical protein
VAAGEDAQVLEHDRLEKRSHQLIRWSSHFLQTVDVGLGEHTTFAGHLVQLDPAVALHRELGHR